MTIDWRCTEETNFKCPFRSWCGVWIYSKFHGKSLNSFNQKTNWLDNYVENASESRSVLPNSLRPQWHGFVYHLHRLWHLYTSLMISVLCISYLNDFSLNNFIYKIFYLIFFFVTPWNSPGQNTGMGRPFLLQGILPTQGSNPGLPHCRWTLYQLSHKRSSENSRRISVREQGYFVVAIWEMITERKSFLKIQFKSKIHKSVWKHKISAPPDYSS